MGGKKRNIGAAQNILQLYSGVDNKPVEQKDDKKDKDKKKDDKESKRPQRRVRIKLDNLMDKTPEISKNAFTFGKNKQNQENIENEKDDDDFTFEEEKCVQYEGLGLEKLNDGRYSMGAKETNKAEKYKKMVMDYENQIGND